VLDRLGISLLPIPGAGCCGALRYHLDQHAAGLNDMRRVIDACWPMIEAGQVEAIVITASGCGSMLKDYREVLAQDSLYAKKANKFSNLCIDLGELLGRDAALLAQLTQLAEGAPTRRLAYHPPCSLQHGQQSRGQAERVQAACGVVLTPVADSHLCCGSAGTYSLLQPTLSEQLRQNKLQALQAGAPEEIVTANIGCQSHLQAASALPVSHWIDALERQLDQAAALRKTTHHGE
jgi:glycolate oxidase iron-sulfur subunit